MISPVANHLWQSTLCAAAAWLLTLVLQQNRAAVRHGIWLAASVKFLVPFSLLADLGGRVGWRLAPEVASVPIPVAVEQLARPFVAEVITVPTVAPSSPLSAILFAIWVCGVAVSAIAWLVLWRRLRTTLRDATPLPLNLPIRVMSSPGRQEPGVFGILRPVLLLPEGIADRLSPEQLRSILAHEICHVRRRDNLTGAIHMVVESIFWFHPLVRWIGARLVEERELACDEEVVRMGNEPHTYAEGILSVCKLYASSPLACASGVTGADLKKRIEAIVANRISHRLTIARKLLLTAAGVAAVVLPLLTGIARSQEKLVFEVASVKRAEPSAQGGGPMALAPGVTPGGGIRSRVPIFNLICWAYRIDGAQLSGGPPWVRSERYVIEAKPEKFEGPDDPNVPPSEQHLNRVRERVKALLADRFRLAVRTETQETSVYVLSVMKGGHKLTPSSEAAGGVSFLGDAIESKSAPISFLAVSLTQMLGRPVLNETGLDGRYKFKLEFRPEDDARRALALSGAPAPTDDPRPSIFTAIKSQLGLELQSRRSGVPAVVIERIERPTEN